MEANTRRLCRAHSPSRIPLSVKWGDVMKAKDETANSYVILTQLAELLGLQSATVKLKAKAIGVELVKIRNPQANNTLCSAVSETEAKRLIEALRSGNIVNHARVLGPDEISKLMEE